MSIEPPATGLRLGSGSGADPEGFGCPNEHHLLQTRSGGPPKGAHPLARFDPVVLLQGLNDSQVLTWATRPPVAAERRQSFPSRQMEEDSDEWSLSGDTLTL